MIPRKYVKFQNTIYMYIRCCNWFLCHYNKKGRVPAPFFNSNFATTTKKTIIVSLFQTFHNLFDSYVSSFHGTSKTIKERNSKSESRQILDSNHKPLHLWSWFQEAHGSSSNVQRTPRSEWCYGQADDGFFWRSPSLAHPWLVVCQSTLYKVLSPASQNSPAHHKSIVWGFN